MPKGRHGGRSKVINKNTQSVGISKDEEYDSSKPAFKSLESKSPLLTLLYDTKTAQHAALSRIEAFYESTNDAQTYLTLEEAKVQRQCQHYEAFNFPIDIVRKWLASMELMHLHIMKDNLHPDDSKEVSTSFLPESSSSYWWQPFCNSQEQHLLAYLDTLGVFKEDLDQDDRSSEVPVYLISTLVSKQSSLRHERLHFLYYISPGYRETVKEEYNSLSSKALKIIERDLAMRKYSPHVWIDEFQAYVSEDVNEFGNSVREECQEISTTLQRHQALLWKELEIC